MKTQKKINEFLGFRVGDRVKSIFFNDFQPTGTIVEIWNTGIAYVKWDDIPENKEVRGETTDEDLYYKVLERIKI